MGRPTAEEIESIRAGTLNISVRQALNLLFAEIDALRAQLAEAVKALEFYAEETKWEVYSLAPIDSPNDGCLVDAGEKARAALARIKEGSNGAER